MHLLFQANLQRLSSSFTILFCMVCSQLAAAQQESLNLPKVIGAYVSDHCLACHSGNEPEAAVSFDSLGSDFSADTDALHWQSILTQLTLGAMPPEDETQPTRNHTQRVIAWIRSELTAAGRVPEVDHKLQSPEFGNYINHGRLFDGSERGPAYSTPRLWRLNPAVYAHFVDGVAENLRRITAIHQPYPIDESKGVISDYAAEHFADAATLELLMMNCETIAQLQTTGVVYRDTDWRENKETLRREKQTPRVFEEILKVEGTPTDEQIDAAIDYEVQLALQRSATTEERTRLASLFKTAAERGGNTRALQTMIMAILMKPEAVYRMEIGLGPKDEHGRRRLSDYELAFAIARALTNKGPRDIPVGPRPKKNSNDESSDDKSRQNLMQLALAGGLETPEQIRKVVIGILDDNNLANADYAMFAEDHRIGNTRVLQFFREFFGYHHAPKVFKDQKRIGFGDRYVVERIVQDADQLVMYLFDQDKDVLAQLLTTDRYFVAYPGSLEKIQKDLHYIKTNVNDQNFRRNTEYVQRLESLGRHPIPIEGPSTREYVAFYNLDPQNWDYQVEQPFQMPKGQRFGMLTHPAWLIAWSGNFDNDPIRRGKWIREHLLADVVPEVPLTVDAVVPEDPEKTLRERLGVTREANCWQCHQKMNPLGLPFEQYDDFGRHRQHEIIGELLTIFPERHAKAERRPIDTRGAIGHSDEQGLEGPVEDVREMVHKLACSTRVRQSFVRHAFRFWMGRNETLADSPTLMAADKAYLAGGGSMKALIASLLSSDSFLYRKPR